MYASDVINRNRAITLHINNVQKNQEFTSGKSIRIDRQRGGIDYQYITNTDYGNLINPGCGAESAISVSRGSNTSIFSVDNMTSINLGAVDASGNLVLFDYGPPPLDASGNILTFNGIRVIDDSSINIPVDSDFYFFGINYAATNNIFWNTNNAITFGIVSPPSAVSVSANSCPAILIGNYDRLCSRLFTTNYLAQGKFAITVIIVYFSDYFTDKTNLDAGKYQIRLIRELSGEMRQWVEVSVLSAVSSPGYSNTYTPVSGRDPSGNSIDANGLVVDLTKNSPYDITNGTNFLNVLGSQYSTVSPQAGTNFVYQSNSRGEAWVFIEDAYLNI